ncbi:Sprouty-related, EVH1 domain-containing protein 2 [Liparis tanakae]|uniref:Sprouty-related, EVH1 domain-containing protein 2 n=1 Tax=Liparis tanakae TaxID=230148 RepID=A0A4Z2EJG3_9TELE|nr:Sprouty-related, EVH1 domain-containing protein 2 [Liparis tanakae]
MWNQATRKKLKPPATSCFPKPSASRGRFLFSCLSGRGVQSASGVHAASCVCPQNTTDSSSNSSQKLESSLQPLESSPLPQRHRCMLGHRHDLHDPYRLSDHYFMDQPLSRLPRHVTFQEDEEIVRINPRERRWEWSAERHYGRPADPPWLKGYEDYRHATVRDTFLQADESESYVHFAKTEQKHDYTYPLSPSDSDPALGPLVNSKAGGGGGGGYHPGLSSAVSAQPRSFLPSSSSPSANGGKGRKEDGLERAQCEHCGGVFYVSDNRRGRCHDAPDPVRACVRRVSCMWLADTMLYHCMSDPEGDYSDPCSCDGGEAGGGGAGGGGGGGRLGSRWLALLGLSLVAPCLCLYPPLHACHRAGLRCGCCGGRHKALS